MTRPAVLRTTNMLVAESIHKRFARRARGPIQNGGRDIGHYIVLREVSLRVETGESAAIVGPSGSGKSTLLNILGTLEPPTEGRVLLDDCDPFALPPRELARFRNAHVGFVFQDHHLLPQCSVLENVLLPTLALKRAADAARRARALLDRVGLSARLDHRPAELSGGEKQRVAIARALMNRPKLVLADEPTGNLDQQTGEEVATLLTQLWREQPLVLVVVTHSESLAARCGRQYWLRDGRLVPR